MTINKDFSKNIREVIVTIIKYTNGGISYRDIMHFSCREFIEWIDVVKSSIEKENQINK